QPAIQRQWNEALNLGGHLVHAGQRNGVAHEWVANRGAVRRRSGGGWIENLILNQSRAQSVHGRLAPNSERVYQGRAEVALPIGQRRNGGDVVGDYLVFAE